MTESVGPAAQRVESESAPERGAMTSEMVASSSAVPPVCGLSTIPAPRAQMPKGNSQTLTALRRQAARAERVSARTVRRHPGGDKLAGQHLASAHSTPAEQAAHDRESQTNFDSMTSEQLVAALQPSVTKETKQLRYVDLAVLPPALQAQVRMIQSIVTEVETELAKEEPREAVLQRLTARFRTGARSWHENDKGKIPPPARTFENNSRAQFFEEMRQGSKGKVPSKQAKKGFDGKRLPYREFTAAGWQQAEQSGRLIYDPVDDVFYLTCKHYDDDKYFCINAPRSAPTSEASTSHRTTDWDFDLLVYQAWEELAADLHAVAAHAEDPTKNAAPALPTAAMTEDALKCVRELYRLRQLYAAALATARATADRERKRIQAHLANVKKFARKGAGYQGSTANLLPYELGADGSIKIAEQFAPLPWCGTTFYVGSVDGYIGYPVNGYPKSGGKVTCPAYKIDTKVGQVGQFFRQCIEDGSVAGQEEMGALTLAGLVAEATRHPAATLEALFTVIQNSPFAASKPAWAANANKALPMATGGTIATGGIAVEVMQQEGRLGREVVIKMLRKYDDKGWQERMKSAAAMAPAEAITQLKAWLFSVLQQPEAQQAVLRAPASSNDRAQANSRDAHPHADVQPTNAAPSKATADTKPKLAVAPTDPLPLDALPAQQIVVPASSPGTPEQDPVGPGQPETVADRTTGSHAAADKSSSDKSSSDKSSGDKSSGDKSSSDKSSNDKSSNGGQPRTRRAGWTHDVYRIQAHPEDDGNVLHPLDVIAEMAESPEYNQVPNFWDAFAAYRADHADEVFTLSPVNSIQWKKGIPPTSLTIMSDEDWDVWEAFKREHPEFHYE